MNYSIFKRVLLDFILPLALANGQWYLLTWALAQCRTKVLVDEAYIPLAKANGNKLWFELK
jgi:hypothetical protein